MQLTQHFTLAELTKSTTAQRLRLDNTPPPELMPRLVRTAEMLERIRSTLGVPVVVTSGYRSRAVNAAVALLDEIAPPSGSRRWPGSFWPLAGRVRCCPR